jgi:hypothetical protein
MDVLANEPGQRSQHNPLTRDKEVNVPTFGCQIDQWIKLVAPRVLKNTVEVDMANEDTDDLTVVPIPGEEDEAERKRIRQSNDRDQEMERHGEVAPHNRGYDEAADGPRRPTIDHVVDE